ncbi:MAG: GTPase HflX [Christensenellaceae bacterium]
MKINGKIDGIKNSVLMEMECIYELRMHRNEFASAELLDVMARFTSLLNREVSVFLSRSGMVLDVSVGDHQSVNLPYMRVARGLCGLSGVRVIHTHPSGSSMLSEVDRGTLVSSRLDAMAAVGVLDGVPTSMCVGFLGETLDEVMIAGAYPAVKIPQAALMGEITRANSRVNEQIELSDTKEEIERVMLIGLNASERSMAELARLADSAGAQVICSVTQNKERNKGFYIGKGKARELALVASAQDIDTAIFNDELSPLESKNLQSVLGLKIVDRTTLILDIFAKHAHTKEGSVQVELAQLKYHLPRLQGEGAALSRIGGGIGMRGPGEKKIEVDRRRIHRRIFELGEEIEKMKEQRELRNTQRKKNNLYEIALVGYTNAGKSSLLNALCDAQVLVQDKLFATLDPITRRVLMPDMDEVLFTDTVGFIEKLPHDLVSAFKSTLEVAANADLLLIVVDASDENCEHQLNVVKEVLDSLGASERPSLIVMNKIDLLEEIPQNTENMIFISAKKGVGIEELLQIAQKKLAPKVLHFQGKIKYDRGDLLAIINKNGKNIEIEYLEDCMEIRAVLPVEVIEKLKQTMPNILPL